MNIKSAAHSDYSHKVLKFINEHYFNVVPDFEKCSNAVWDLQLYLATYKIDPSNVEDEFFDVTFFRIIRDCLEIGVFSFLKTKEFTRFEVASSQLRMMYTNLDQYLKESYHKYHIIALSLVSSIAKGNIDDFYFTVSTISPFILANNDYLRIPIDLQALFTTGSYRELFEIVENLPHDGFEFFADSLLEQIRHCVSSDIKFSTINVAPSDLKQLLDLKTDDEVTQYMNQSGWTIDSQGLVEFNNICTYNDALPIENFRFSTGNESLNILSNMISQINKSVSADPVTSVMTQDLIKMAKNYDRLI